MGMIKPTQAAVERVSLIEANLYISDTFYSAAYLFLRGWHNGLSYLEYSSSDPLTACQLFFSWTGLPVSAGDLGAFGTNPLHHYYHCYVKDPQPPYDLIIYSAIVLPLPQVCPQATPRYVYNVATNFCERTIEQYTIALSGLGGDVMPNATRAAYAQVINNSNGLPKSGAQVALSLTVVPASGDPTLPSNVGRLSPNGGSTGADGRLPFVFTAPSASGTHTITATCTNCTNVATGIIKIPSCPIADLPPITDPDVLAFEANPNLSDTARLDPTMQTALACLTTAASGAGGTPTVGSAYRPPAYNNHLIDVWKKWKELTQQDNPACVPLKSKIQQHFQRHGLIETQGPVLNSRHTRGLAVDVTISLPSANIDTLAAGCGLRRPLPVRDRVHFQFP